MNWQPNDQGGFSADAGNGVTLSAMPVEYTTRMFTTKPKRGTKWRAFCWYYDAEKRIGQRHGRDVWRDLCDTSDAAKKLAETIYNENIR